MRYIIASTLFSAAAAQATIATIPVSSPAILNLPAIPVLPLQGIPDVLSGNGYNSIADSLNKAAQSLGIHADAAAVANAKITGNVSANPNILATFDLIKAAGGASATLWQLAYDLESKVCSVATSINQQNLATQQANLVAAVQAQITAIARLRQTIMATVSAVQSQAGAFSDAEKAIITSAIQGLVSSVNASSQPLLILASGLKNVGITTISDLANTLQVQSNALATYAARVDFTGA
ncbi:hypothetical protein P171DRAFT_499724 [Karstenula rhodostoma CBS 690.94]|uniref:Uncharacterized protein n=1 Tax=Karstenula rhodostoma CBS 690.94 TaxID=1392251 RepID=A0A9P4U6Q7_9PLEO|nr:hypothetical protein P171DRAFT_499724 [Karstenula rhodostoma CBS 690.94]